MAFSLPMYVGIILQKNDEFFLIQRRNTDWMSGYWNFPGGLVEKGESLVNAAIREASEEIGVVIKAADFKLVHVIHVRKEEHNTQDIVGVYFLTQHWQGTAINNENDKIIDAQWFDKDNLPKSTTEHAQLALGGLLNNVFYSESGW